MNPRSVGVAAGLVTAAASIASNAWRGDRHLVSVVPDVLTAVVMGVMVFVAVHRAAARHPASARTAGQQTSLAASGVFATGIAAFALWYLPSHSLAMAGFVAIAGFALLYVVGFLATRFVTRHAIHRAAARR